MIPPGTLTARYAALVDAGLTIPAIRDLTPRQIQSIYFHARDQDGAIVVPAGAAPAPADHATRLAQLVALAPMLGVPADQIALLTARLEALTNGDATGTG